MSHSCPQWRGDLGAYLVGALDHAARDRVGRHLAACPGCQADYDELAPVRDQLSRLPPAAAGAEPGPDAGYPAQPAPMPPATRTRMRRWLLAAGTCAAAAAVAISLLVSVGASARTFRAVDSATGITGHAQLHQTPTGTQIDLTATGLPANERCILVAVTRDGTDIAGSWDAAYDGSARIAGTTAFAANQLTALRIQSASGIVLLRIHV